MPVTKPLFEVSRLTTAAGEPLSRSLVETLIDRHETRVAPRLAVLWAYYRNPMHAGPAARHGRSYRLAQEQGLPPRILGPWDRRSPAPRFAGDDRATHRKEVVIENDICWRIPTMVDFRFGRPLTITSTAADPALRAPSSSPSRPSGSAAAASPCSKTPGSWATSTATLISSFAPPRCPSGMKWGRRRVWGWHRGRRHGRVAKLRSPSADRSPTRAHAAVRVELIEPPRGVALPSASDYREPRRRTSSAPRASPSPMRPPRRARPHRRDPPPLVEAHARCRARRAHPPDRPQNLITITEIFAGGTRQLFEQSPDGQTRLIDEGPALVSDHPGDRPPIAHIQNISQPFEYAGVGDVEPLIPLQDELNTRLSDRANRVTLQSFKMYLAKGLDGAASMPVAPGVVWSTDNPDAQITAFGGDADSPSEDRHIDEIREAMDKASAVPPLASGVVRAKIGNLSSENALRITLLGLMSKTGRKRITYGRGIVHASTLILEALHRLGILHTTPADRGLRIDWIDPIPRDEQQSLLAAQKKVELGVPRERVLSELGYATQRDEDTELQ